MSERPHPERKKNTMIRTVNQLVTALDDACDGFRAEFIRGAALAGDLASSLDIVGVRNYAGRIILDLRDPRGDEELRDVYINDRDRPDVESPAEAVQAARDFFLGIGARVVAYGEPRRNDDRSRWEVPVSTRPLPEPRITPPVMEFRPDAWKPSGWVLLERGRTGAECCCCGKPSRELIMMILERYVPSRQMSFWDAYQVDVGHYARRKGITVDQARAEVDAAIEAERARVRGGQVAKEPVHGRGWGLYGADGEPLLKQEVFPTRAKAQMFLADLLALLDGDLDYTSEKIQELIERHDGRHVYDLVLQSLPAALG